MIIFDLDGTLADCEHRRHFVDPKKNDAKYIFNASRSNGNGWTLTEHYENSDRQKWKPDWNAFFEACDKDSPIQATIKIINELHGYDYYATCEDVHIWSARCESVRDKTLKWLDENRITFDNLKMRPLGNTEPDEVLKERWLDEALVSGKKIDFVFDDRPKVVRMWRRKGIFVFNCCQHDEEF